MHAAHSMLSSKELVCVIKIRVAFPHFRVARKPLGHMALRKVLGKREARIISRLRSIAGMSTPMIAKVTEHDKKSIYNVLKGKLKFAKRGPMPKTRTKTAKTMTSTRGGMWMPACGVQYIRDFRWLAGLLACWLAGLLAC